MNKKICVTSVYSLGCTFIDWSIHFLSGQTQFYRADLDQYLDLSHDPLTSTNAHGHRKNHPCGSAELTQFLEQFNQHADQGIFSAYPHIIPGDQAAQVLSIPLNQVHKEHNHTAVLDYVLEDFNKFFKICNDTNTKLIFVAMDKRTILHHQSVRSLDRLSWKRKKPSSDEEVRNEMQEIFFSESIEKWNQMNLNNIWDRRERIALDTRPLHNRYVDSTFDFQYPHLWINCQELWLTPVGTIKKILKYLEIEIDKDRLRAWLPISQKWQQLHTNLLEFCYIQPHIVDAIVNDWDYEIDLTFEQEAIIQHFLIYQHNLNLKTWQLEKFPNNTRELHKLLEPNTHQVEDIYSVRSTS